MKLTYQDTMFAYGKLGILIQICVAQINAHSNKLQGRPFAQ